MASYLSKFANFDLPHLHLAPPLGVTPFEFRKDFGHQKTRVPGLSCGVICMTYVKPFWYNTGLSQTDKDRQTQGHGIYRESIARAVNTLHQLVRQNLVTNAFWEELYVTDNALPMNSLHYWQNYYNRFTALCPGLPKWVVPEGWTILDFVDAEMMGQQWH